MAEGIVPLIVGVTGHRDLVDAELPALELALEKFFNFLKTEFADVPVLLLTGVAEGADSLAADVAHRCGCDVQLVLPMPVELYQADFEGAARERFDQYCQKFPTKELSIVVGQDEADLDRDLQYARLGSFLAAHSHILLALWDGKYSTAVGGTSQVVEFHQTDITLDDPQAQRSRLDIRDDESDLVYHIACSRISSGAPIDGLTPGNSYWFTREDEQPRVDSLPPRYQMVFERIREFNQEVRKRPNQRSPYELAPTDLSIKAQEKIEAIRAVYQASDGLASFYQKRVMLSLRCTIVAALLAGLSFILYADFAGQGGMIWFYLAFALLAIGGYMVADRFDWQRRYLDYRVLAEGLRVQFYWALAGVEMSNANRYSHDSIFQGRDLQLGWIRNVMRFTGLQADLAQVLGDDERKLAIANWVGDNTSGQMGYYREKSAAMISQHRRSQRLITACFSLGILSALILASGFTSGLVENLFIALMGLFPILAAARQNYAHRMAERELVAQYAYMSDVYENAHRLIEASADEQDVLLILKDLGEAALNENAQWVLRQRERPLPGGDAMS